MARLRLGRAVAALEPRVAPASWQPIEQERRELEGRDSEPEPPQQQEQQLQEVGSGFRVVSLLRGEDAAAGLRRRQRLNGSTPAAMRCTQQHGSAVNVCGMVEITSD
jgi:hypothetical protein